MTLWLDDIRNPIYYGCIGAKWVKTVDEAKVELAKGIYTHVSLDHDLGACEDCMSQEEWESGMVMPNCDHYGTGYNLVCWLEEEFHYGRNWWPKVRVEVHSANAVGAARMRQVINKFYDEEGRRIDSVSTK